MKKYKLTKVIASFLIALSAIALSPIAANAEWKQDSNGWWYSEGSGYAIGEKKIDGKEYYFNSSGYMTTGWQDVADHRRYYDKNGCIKVGWLQDGNKLYYISPLGKYMLTNNYFDGYYLNNDGIATKCIKVGNYEIDKATGTLVRYNGNDAEVVIPKTIDGVEIKSIAYSVFSNLKTLSSITIPDSVTHISDNAFNNCKGLTSINIDENNKNYASVDGVLFNKTKTVLIKCPEGKIAENYAIPDSVDSLEAYAFENCYSLKGIIVPVSVQSIGKDAFEINANTKYYAGSEAIKELLSRSPCVNPSNIVLGTENYIASNGYKEKADTAVSGNSLSSNGIYATNLPKVANESDFIFDSMRGVITGYTGHDSVFNIPKEINGVPVREIGESAFKNNLSIVSVTIPDSVTSIESCAFEGCTNLKNVTIPLSLGNFHNDSFKGCTNLININGDAFAASRIKEGIAYYEKLKGTSTSQSSSNS